MRTHSFILLIFALLLLLQGSSCRKSDYFAEEERPVFRDMGEGTGTVTWKKGNDYLLEGLVFVNDGQVLTIEAGTVIRFREGQGENASALIVARGGRIIARGTPDEPIIFTAEKDDLEEAIPLGSKGLWGGLILLGNAPVNTPGNEGYIEGIPPAEPRAYFGGNNPDSDSGVLSYVSIRHGGTNIGDGNEINGLTLAGVGRGTEIDYVEIFSNADDGVEIFGGTVNLRHMAVWGCGDDAFDIDLGWSGFGQFWLGVQTDFTGNNLVELTGGTLTGSALFPHPWILNATFAGNGSRGAGNCADFSRNAGGHLANSLFMHKLNGISLEATNLSNDSFSQWINGNLSITNTHFYEVAGNSPGHQFLLSGFYTPDKLQQWRNAFSPAGNLIEDPLIDPENYRFKPAEKIRGPLTSPPSPWFQITDFRGAFGESNWLSGWSKLSQLAQ